RWDERRARPRTRLALDRSRTCVHRPGDRSLERHGAVALLDDDGHRVLADHRRERGRQAAGPVDDGEPRMAMTRRHEQGGAQLPFEAPVEDDRAGTGLIPERGEERNWRGEDRRLEARRGADVGGQLGGGRLVLDDPDTRMPTDIGDEWLAHWNVRVHGTCRCGTMGLVSIATRRGTPTVDVGGVLVGSAHPVVVQSMTNTD